MERLKDGPLARALERGRSRYNARFAQARRIDRALDGEAFAEHLCHNVDPILRNTGTNDSSHIDALTETLYDLSLELFAAALLGSSARSPIVALIWSDLLPRLSRFLDARPRALIGALCNGAHAIGRCSEDAALSWIDALEQLAPLCNDREALLDCGKVLAWRFGLAHYRESAVAVWRQLPEELQAASLALPQDADPSSTRLDDPWQRPGADQDAKRSLTLVARVGGFRGFDDGPFLSPPTVIAQAGELSVVSEEGRWTLHADCFGHTLQRCGDAGATEAETDLRPFRLSKAGTVHHGKQSKRFVLLRQASSAAATEHTLAVTLPWSHQVFLVALT